jgi:hypothetical protein
VRSPISLARSTQQVDEMLPAHLADQIQGPQHQVGDVRDREAGFFDAARARRQLWLLRRRGVAQLHRGEWLLH